MYEQSEVDAGVDAAVELGGKTVVERLLVEEPTLELVDSMSEERLLVVAVDEEVVIVSDDDDEEDVETEEGDKKDEVELDEIVLGTMVDEDTWAELVVELTEKIVDEELLVVEVDPLLALGETVIDERPILLDVVVEVAEKDSVVMLLEDDGLLVLDVDVAGDWLLLLVLVDDDVDEKLLLLGNVLVDGLLELEEELLVLDDVETDNVLELVSVVESDEYVIFEDNGADEGAVGDTFDDEISDGKPVGGVRGVVDPESTKKL